MKNLPSNLDAERFVLGSILVNEDFFPNAIAKMESWDFSLEKHRRIFESMTTLYQRAERIDRVTVADELMRRGHLESVDGLAYLISLDDGLPEVANIDAYLRIVVEKSERRRMIFDAHAMIQKLHDESLEAKEIAAEAAKRLMDSSRQAESNEAISPSKIIEKFPGGVSAFLDPSSRPQGLTTGFVKLDQMTGGFRGGELIIIAARPSMGKTALALNIADHHIQKVDAKPVLIFSLEMSDHSLLTRMVCARARIDSHKHRAGYLNPEERRRVQVAVSDLCSSPLRIGDSSSITTMDVHAISRDVKRRDGLAMVIVDYLQLLSSHGRPENRNIEVSKQSRELKMAAKDLDVPFVVLSQLSRATEGRADSVPRLSDLRDSGAIEQDADAVAFLYREEIYKPDREDLKGIAELILAKQRNGPIGKIPLSFISQYTRFENRIDDLDELDG